MKRTSVLYATILLCCSIGCTNSTEDDLLQNGDNTDTVVTYNANIKTILATNCTGCHSDPPKNGAPFPLDTYARVKNLVESGNLIDAIRKQTGESGAMPPNGRLPQATIDLINQWIKNGYPEN